jgi:hypothetical protein
LIACVRKIAADLAEHLVGPPRRRDDLRDGHTLDPMADGQGDCDPLLAGDLLFNPAWSSTQPEHVAIAGIIH